MADVYLIITRYEKNAKGLMSRYLIVSSSFLKKSFRSTFATKEIMKRMHHLPKLLPLSFQDVLSVVDIIKVFSAASFSS